MSTFAVHQNPWESVQAIGAGATSSEGSGSGQLRASVIFEFPGVTLMRTAEERWDRGTVQCAHTCAQVSTHVLSFINTKRWPLQNYHLKPKGALLTT